MYKKLLTETMIYGVGAIAPRVINFIINPFIFKFVDSEEYSIFTQLYAAIAFINIVLTFGFETAFFRFSSEEGKSKTVFNTSFLFLAFNALFFLILALIFIHPIANQFGYEAHPEYLVWFACIAFFDTLCVIPLAWLRYNNKPIKYSLIKVIQSSTQLILTLGFFYVVSEKLLQSFGLTDKISYPFFGNFIGAILGFLMVLPIVFKVQWKFDFQLLKKMLPYALPIMVAGLAFVTNEHLDKLVQREIISESDAGAYGGCYKLAVIMSLMVTAYRLGIEPFFFKQMHSANAKNIYADVMNYFVVFMSLAGLALIVNLDWIKNILIDNQQYWIALDIVPIIVIAYLFFGIYYNLSTWYKVTDKTWVGTVISWIGALSTLGLTFWLLPKFGFMASAWITLGVYFLMMVISYFWGQMKYPIPYKTGKIILYLTLTILLAYLSYIVFDNNFWIGNGLLLLFTAFILYMERQNLSILNRLIK